MCPSEGERALGEYHLREGGGEDSAGGAQLRGGKPEG